MPGILSASVASDWLSWVSSRSAWQQPPHPPSNPDAVPLRGCAAASGEVAMATVL